MPEKPFTTMTDLAAEKLGGKTLLCSDDFFAEKENLLKPGRGIFIEGKYTDRGKWTDGWESRRKRVPGNDWCIIQLASPGRIYGVDIDTNNFLVDYPPFASVQAFNIKDADTDDFEQLKWIELLPKSSLQPGSQNLYSIGDEGVYTHLRLNIFPDGGIARFKAYGEVVIDWEVIGEDEQTDLVAAVNGGRAVACNDMFFSHMGNLLMPGSGVDMGDGWETRRSRKPDNKDWVILQLGHAGVIRKITIDTAHFKGNYPDTCMLEGAFLRPDEKIDFLKDEIKWALILPQAKLEADQEHFFETSTGGAGPYSHVRLTIFPDGGISRIRLFGSPVPDR